MAIFKPRPTPTMIFGEPEVFYRPKPVREEGISRRRRRRLRGKRKEGSLPSWRFRRLYTHREIGDAVEWVERNLPGATLAPWQKKMMEAMRQAEAGGRIVVGRIPPRVQYDPWAEEQEA